MSTSTKRLRAAAIAQLAHVRDDIRDIDMEILAISKELEMLVAKMNDAKWAGDLKKGNGVFYQIILRRTMREILQKRRKAKMKEMTK